MTETPMSRRFKRARWSPLRVAMDAMKHGEVLTFHRAKRTDAYDQCNLARVIASRQNEAYYGIRSWVVKTTGPEEFSISHTQIQTP